MTTFQNRRTVKNPRKPHRCAHCASTIPAGVSHVQEAGFWDGDFYTMRAHHDCAALWAELYTDYGDPWEGMAHDICEAIGDEGRGFVQDVYDSYRGHYPHVICRLELRWQRGDIRGRDRYRALGLEPDPEDYPEVYG